ncbi:hypothetical protein TNCV_2949251 [Trichonephila clavipes]|nr:hypothetical protein TNCV_2949251 [Trichonephila clavipes]
MYLDNTRLRSYGKYTASETVLGRIAWRYVDKSQNTYKRNALATLLTRLQSDGACVRHRISEGQIPPWTLLELERALLERGCAMLLNT